MSRIIPTLATLAILAACQNTGPVISPNPQTLPVRSIAQPSDGFYHEDD